MPQPEDRGLSDQEIAAQQATALPDREAMSLLDIAADLNLDLNLAAPIEAAVAANAVRFAGKVVVLVVSGARIAPAKLAEVLA